MPPEAEAHYIDGGLGVTGPQPADRGSDIRKHLLAGGGVVQTSRSADLKPAGMLGIGAHLYFNRWLALVGEFRDQVYVEKFNAGNRVMNHVMFQLGLSLWIPFDFEYRFS